jgi:hypothetical protein
MLDAIGFTILIPIVVMVWVVAAVVCRLAWRDFFND